MVGLESLRPDLRDLDEIPEVFLVFLSQVGMVEAGLVMLCDEPDPLVDDGELTEGHGGQDLERRQCMKGKYTGSVLSPGGD